MATKSHVRSISLPSRSHPSTLQIEEELNKIKTSEISSTSSSSSSSSSICSSLSGLENLFQCLDNLLSMASTQQVMSKFRHEKSVDELLDQSVRLLDVCGVARDIMFQAKEQIYTLQSSLRRRKGDSVIEDDVINYISFRKKMRKEVRKSTVTLKQVNNRIGELNVSNQDHVFLAVIRVLREVNAVTISVYQSLFSFLGAKQTTWYVVSKLMMHNKGGGVLEQENEFEVADAAIFRCNSGVEKMVLAQKRLEGLECSIQVLENGLECVFRRLVKTRASLLNIISQ